MLDAAADFITDFGVLGVRPAIEPEMQPFWAAAERGQLVVEQCNSCGLHVFPMRGVCRRCLSRSLSVVVVEPPAVLYSYTVNHHSWAPGMGRYPLGIVDLPGLDGIRLVGLLAGFTEEPQIDQLVGFRFAPSEALGGLVRLHFMPWDSR